MVLITKVLQRTFKSLLFRSGYGQRIANLETSLDLVASLSKFDNPISLYHKFLGELQVRIPLGKELIRIGSIHDGGYVLLNDFSNIKTVISLGVGRNVEQELFFANLNKRVLLFDGTINKLPKTHPNFTFIKANVYGRLEGAFMPPNALEFREVLREYTITSPPPYFSQVEDNLLLIDIEGAEYSILNEISVGELNAFHQITIEFHDIFSHLVLNFFELIEILKKLKTFHELISIHGNNYGASLLNPTTKQRYPNVLEMTWVRKCDMNFMDGVNSLEHPLNKPNNPLKEDFTLYW